VKTERRLLMSIGWRVSIPAVAMLLATAVQNVPAQTRYHGTGVVHGGTVKGAVRLSSAPARASFDRVTKDEAVCGKRKPSPRLLTGAANGVRFAVVWIDGIMQGKKGAPPGTAFLSQRRCEYGPHVLLMNPGDELEIVNDDAVLHNVHAYDLGNKLRSVFNIAQPMRGFRTRVRASDIAGVHIMLTTCDAGHPWMSAYIVRASSPYWTVTDANGKFQIGDVPPGTYTLKMWHEGIATHPSTGGPGTPPVVEEPYVESKQIRVKPDEVVMADFTFSPRSAVASN
jgi:plastocyanin